MKNLIFCLCATALILSSCSKDNSTFSKIETKSGSTFKTLKSGAVVEKRGDRYFVGGDVALSPIQLKLLDETGSIFPSPSFFAKPTDSILVNPITGMQAFYKYDETSMLKAVGKHPYQNAYWAMVRFTYGPNLSNNAKDLARQAMLYIESQTNARFYNATGQPTVDPTYGFAYPYIEIIDNENPVISWSNVGRIGGKQNLAIGALAGVGTVVHEFCHALAMYHEQARADRDDYIIVNYSNISDEGNAKAQFNKITNNYFIIGDFDFNSIMLYGSYSFSANGLPTMVKKSDNSTWIGNQSVLSDNDRRWINSFYLPYIARKDVYSELAPTVYKADNTIMSPEERLRLQARLNYGNPNPPEGGRIPNEL